MLVATKKSKGYTAETFSSDESNQGGLVAETARHNRQMELLEAEKIRIAQEQEAEKIRIGQEQNKWKEKATELEYKSNELEYKTALFEKFEILKLKCPRKP